MSLFFKKNKTTGAHGKKHEWRSARKQMRM